MTTAPKPNRQAVEAGEYFAGLVAVNLTAALEHIHRELTTCDGFGERGDSVVVSASSESTSTERAMMARYELTEMRESLRDALSEAVEAVRRLGWTAQAAMRLRAPQGVVAPNTAKLCRDGITDRTRRWSIEDAGGFDPTCMSAVARLGLCRRHYDRFRYWCRVTGIELPDEMDDPPAPGIVRSTVEVIVRDGQLGVRHVAAAQVRA